ncbi:hypothetical protein LTR09_007115 [Extremus antarcticus]|uniref:Uncharacterized protein n=1 Tax=Extremus antarcticus TaxID=702011 RepID=A0AAJ0DD66_9PEZI|nr:hypothetical protein LTR09_007115 [Extremus antarcticus]
MVNYATTPDATNLAGSRSAVGSGSALQKRTPVAQATTIVLKVTAAVPLELAILWTAHSAAPTAAIAIRTSTVVNVQVARGTAALERGVVTLVLTDILSAQITSTQTFSQYTGSVANASSTASSSSGAASGSGTVSSSGAAGSSGYPQYHYTTFTYFQVVYFHSQGESTTSLDSSTITKQTLLSAYASNNYEAETMFTSMERSIQAHASATTLPLATSGPSASSSASPAVTINAAGVSGLSRHMLSRTDIPSMCLLALGGLAGVLAVAL